MTSEPKTRSDILLHPTRLRIVLSMAGDGLTTRELHARLPDVAPATLYRHVAILADAGMLEVVEEHRIRGVVERTYRVVTAAVALGPEDAAVMSADEHLAGFVTFAGALIDAFGRYLHHPASDPSSDWVGYRQAALWLTGPEREAIARQMSDALEPFLERGPSPGRSRSLFTTILIPDPAATPASEDISGI